MPVHMHVCENDMRNVSANFIHDEAYHDHFCSSASGVIVLKFQPQANKRCMYILGESGIQHCDHLQCKELCACYKILGTTHTQNVMHRVCHVQLQLLHYMHSETHSNGNSHINSCRAFQAQCSIRAPFSLYLMPSAFTRCPYSSKKRPPFRI